MFWSFALLSSNIKHGNGSGLPLFPRHDGLNIGAILWFNKEEDTTSPCIPGLFSPVVFWCVFCCFFLFCSPVPLQKNTLWKKNAENVGLSIEVWLRKPRISLKRPGGRLVSSFRPLRSLATFEDGGCNAWKTDTFQDFSRFPGSLNIVGFRWFTTGKNISPTNWAEDSWLVKY